jgi:hypothetical protein
MDSHEFNFRIGDGLKVYHAKLGYDKNNEYNYHITDNKEIDCWYKQEEVTNFINTDKWRFC